jgi:drug/metabolite transporter (DMT)-like permease
LITAGIVAAALTAVFYGVTPPVARRAIRLLGFVRANLWRLVIALVVLGALAFAVGGGFGDQYLTFALAGAVGFGIGGIAMFRALPLLGAPLSSLVVETTAAVVAGFLAWQWFGDALTGKEIAFCLVILAGVVIGLVPYVRGSEAQPRLKLGLTFAGLSAVAQAASGVISRKGMMAVQKAENLRNGGPKVKVGSSYEHVFSAAFDRLAGGVLVALVILVAAMLLRRTAGWARAGLTPAAQGAEPGAVWTKDLGKLGSALPDRPWFWVGANALFGPILGVTCMVWALQTMQPGVVQSIAAMAPLIAIPFARWLEGYKPPRSYYPGAVIAVAGLVALTLAQG